MHQGTYINNKSLGDKNNDPGKLIANSRNAYRSAGQQREQLDLVQAMTACTPKAVLLFDGVELMDFAGPVEVFIVADKGKAFRVVTVAESTRPIKTMGGITVTPDYTLKDAPKPDIIVVPGGNTQDVGKDGRQWLTSAAQDASITMSVCFGAFLLADTGLLDGVEATTHSWGSRA